MKVNAFDYGLPEGRVAQRPAEPRDAARLLVHDVQADATQHAIVRELERFLDPGDLLVVNDTRVRPARLLGRRQSGGSVELLVLGPGEKPGTFRAMVRPAKRLRPGEILEIEGGAFRVRALERRLDGDGEPGPEWSLECAVGAPSWEEGLERVGRMPLPPYIQRLRTPGVGPQADRDWYQTIFAREPGAVAAPTAGLHFTEELLGRLDRKGVERVAITLHVGPGTFLPVTAELVEDHRMQAETYRIGAEVASAFGRTRSRGGRVVAVGTTSARALESACDDTGLLRAGAGETRLFITPGYRFRAVDALFTNFHLPRSTLLMLVSAFAGRERILGLYAQAIERGYRFYSYGDAMLLRGATREATRT